MATKHDLLAKLQQHIGAANGIRGEDLARELDVPVRQVRHLISLAIEEDGSAICGTPATGYYMARIASELKQTIDFHKSRALNELRKASRLARIPLPDLIGQLHLRT